MDITMRHIEVPTTNGGRILVDADTWDMPHSCEFRDGFLFVARPSEIQWGMQTRGQKENKIAYACRQIKAGGKVRQVALHRLLMDALASEHVDHRNNNGMDNRRENLRECTHGDNMKNRRPNSGRRFKGIRVRYTNRWMAEIWSDNQYIYLGTYSTQQEAAEAYDRAALKYHGEFASLNFPETN